MLKSTIFSILIFITLTAGIAAIQYQPVTTVPESQNSPSAKGSLTPLEPCEFKPGKKKVYQAECATLTVPEKWEDPHSKTISLPVVRFPATSANPTEPIFWLQGGPGSPNLSWAPPDWLLKNHDVILVGYRGAEGSTVLDCPDLTKMIKKSLGKGVFSEEIRQELEIATQQCAQGFADKGIDLNDYIVSSVIQDFEAARTAMGYEKVNLYSVSYGTRVAQIYAYLHPESLNRVVLIGLNTPGHFIYDREEFDVLIGRMNDLCQSNPDCAGSTDNLAQAISDVNHNMPDHWLFFPIDQGTVRLGAHMMFFSTQNMAIPIDMYVRASNGDPAGLAMMTMMAKYVFPPITWGDMFTKGGSLDGDRFEGIQTVDLGDSILGAPLAEMIWQMAAGWPVAPEAENLRQLNESDVSMLVVNGDIDFSTPPSAIEEAKPYWHNAQFVLLSGFSHVDDVEKLQPAAFQQLITTYYDSGEGDASQFIAQPLVTKPGMSLATMAKLILAGTILLPPLLIVGVLLGIRRARRRRQK